MKKTRRKKPAENTEQVILLRDLAPRAGVKGGAGKFLFGERLDDGSGASVGGAADERPRGDRSNRKS